MSPVSSDSCPYKKRKHLVGGRGEMKAEAGVMLPQTKGHQEPREARRDTRKSPPLELAQGSNTGFGLPAS